MASFNARFYRVTHCGYYKWGDPEPTIAGLEETLSALAAWSTGKSLLATRVPGIGEKLPSYLFDIKNHGRCWLIVLWNEVPAEDGKVASVMGTDIVGGVGVNSTALAAGSIPGFPTYSAFFPEDELFVALKYSDVIAGTQQLKGYMDSFLSNSAPWVRVDTSNRAEPEILGYVDDDDDDDEIQTDIAPRFGIQVIKTGGERALMISKVADIRKIIRVHEVNTLRAPGRAWFQRALAVAGLEGEPRGRKVRVKQEIPVRMTRTQLVSLLDSVEEEIEPKKNDVAVMFKKDPRPHWLSGVIPNLDIELNIDRVNGVFPAGGLARRIGARREALLEASGL